MDLSKLLITLSLVVIFLSGCVGTGYNSIQEVRERPVQNTVTVNVPLMVAHSQVKSMVEQCYNYIYNFNWEMEYPIMETIGAVTIKGKSTLNSMLVFVDIQMTALNDDTTQLQIRWMNDVWKEAADLVPLWAEGSSYKCPCHFSSGCS